jgi:RND family efflux transporter MFP subunit
MKTKRTLFAIVILAASALGAHAQQWTVRGITEPIKDATLGATVAGIVASINKQEGETVRQGEVILELDKEQEALEVERRKLIAESKVEVTAAQYRVETIRLELDTARQLYESTRSVPREELQQKELEYKLAQAEVERLSIAEEREQLEYKIALEELRRRIITAPFDGVIIKQFLEVGEACNPQAPLVRIADISRCRLVIHMEASASRGLEPRVPVQIKIDGVRSPAVLRGTVEYVSPVVDPSSGLREVKVLFDNPGGLINPGLPATLLMK